jgi:hypothetical protein
MFHIIYKMGNLFTQLGQLQAQNQELQAKNQQLQQQYDAAENNAALVFDLSGAFLAQKDYVLSLQKRPDTDPTVSASLNNVQANLDALYKDFSNASGSSAAVLDHQAKMNNIVSTELDRLNKKKQNVDLAIEGQKRMVKLNDSYRKKYSYYVKIIILIIVFLSIFVLINVISKYLTFIPSFVFDIFYFLLAVTLVFTIYFIYLDIIWRDNMNFDELTFNPPNITDPNAVALAKQQSSKLGNLLGTIDVIGCVGNNCCDPATSIWDSGNSVCKGISHFTSMGDVQIGGSATALPDHATEFGQYTPYK